MLLEHSAFGASARETWVRRGRGGEQEHRYKARPLSHWSSPECRRAFGTSLLPGRGSQVSALCSGKKQSPTLLSSVAPLIHCPQGSPLRAPSSWSLPAGQQSRSEQLGMEEFTSHTKSVLVPFDVEAVSGEKRAKYEEHTWFQSHCAKINFFLRQLFLYTGIQHVVLRFVRMKCFIKGLTQIKLYMRNMKKMGLFLISLHSKHN